MDGHITQNLSETVNIPIYLNMAAEISVLIARTGLLDSLYMGFTVIVVSSYLAHFLQGPFADFILWRVLRCFLTYSLKEGKEAKPIDLSYEAK